MKINNKELKDILVEFFGKVKDFKFTKYLLARKEKDILSQIEKNKGLIEFHKEQMIIDEAHITATECEIAILNKDIKRLEDDVKKIVKVINLYIV